MARRGRFAKQTGGSNISQLVYDLMRTQFNRQASAMSSAYFYNSDYRGGGVPSASDVLAFLNEYKGNGWITSYEKDQIDLEIAKVMKEEATRQNNILVTKINENPGDISAVRNYIDFLKGSVNSAGSPFSADEAKNKLYDANIQLAKALGNALGNNLITKDEFTAQARQIMGAFTEDNASSQNIKEALFNAEFVAEKGRWDTKLATANGKGAGAYAAETRKYIAWLKGVRTKSVESGLGVANGNGDVVNGTATARAVQAAIGNAQAELTKANRFAAQEAAKTNLTKIRNETGEFLNVVNTVLGSSYGSIEQFAANQIDVSRFYSMAPGAARISPDFIDRDKLINMLFTGQNSLKETAKLAGDTTTFQNLSLVQKGYGINTLVDDVGMLFGSFMDKASQTSGDAKANTALVDKMISDLTNLINKGGAGLDPLELSVHRQTLQDIIDARAGKLPDVSDGFSSWDLANPYSSQYEAMTGRQQTAFTDIIGSVANDSAIVQDLDRGFVQSAVMGLDGKWHLGPAVNPAAGEASGLTTMINVNGKYIMAAVGGSIIQAPGAQAGTPNEDIGFFYDLGNGNFRVIVNGVSYKQNYNPFTGESSTANDFRAAYVPRSNIVTPYNSPAGQSSPVFIVPSSKIADGAERGLGTSGDADKLFDSIRTRLDALAGDGISPDRYDQIRDSIISTARTSIVGTEWESQFDALFPTSTSTTPAAGGSGKIPGVPNLSGGPGASRPGSMPSTFATPMSGSEFNTFRAGERDMGTTTPAFTGEGFLNYTFRNTPIGASANTSSLFKSTPLGGVTSPNMIAK